MNQNHHLSYEAFQDYIQFFESLEKINQAIQSSTNPDQMLDEGMKTVFNLFGCDRVFLLYPCDPDTRYLKVYFQRTRSEYPGTPDLDKMLSVDVSMKNEIVDVLNGGGPVTFGLGSEKPLSTYLHNQFTIQSQMLMSIHPKIGSPWIMGMHQCSNPRIWTNQEKRLFNEIGMRITEGLNSLLYFRALKDSEEKFRAIFESSRDAILLFDPENGYVDCNPVALEMFAVPSKEAFCLLTRANLSPEYQPDGSLSADRGKKEIDKALIEGVNHFEWWHRGKDGREFPADVLATRMELEGRTVLYGTIRDITELHRAEEEKIRLEKQYLQNQKLEAMGRLAGGVAHDLNNLLTPIVGYGELLLADHDLEDSCKKKVDQIVKAGFRARDLVHQLLAFSRNQMMVHKPLNMNKVVTGFEKLLRLAIRENIETEIILSPDIQPVMADIGQIEQVIMNLVINATDAMPEGGRLTIETALANLDENYAADHPGVRPGEYVMLAFSDTGCGMDDEICKHLFEPFFSTKGNLGTGLGLATSYGIVKQHGGNIWIYSEPGKGSTFKIYLPAHRATVIEDGIDEQILSSLDGSETILLVEDDKNVRELVDTALSKHGYTVRVAESGTEALKLMVSHDGSLDLLLTDVIMYGMNGKELFNRAVQKKPGLKVLFMSDYTDNVIAHHGNFDQDVQLIQKPFTIHELLTRVRAVL